MPMPMPTPTPREGLVSRTGGVRRASRTDGGARRDGRERWEVSAHAQQRASRRHDV